MKTLLPTLLGVCILLLLAMIRLAYCPREVIEVRVKNLGEEWRAQACSEAGYTLTAVWHDGGVQVRHYERPAFWKRRLGLNEPRPD